MAGENPVRIAWVKRQACCVPGVQFYQSEAHHPQDHKGMGLRAHDDQAIPLCLQHHRDWHGATGYFKGWTKSRRKAWQREMVETYRQAWEAQLDIALPVVVVSEEGVF